MHRSCRLATLTAAVQTGQRRINMKPEIIILFVMFYLLLEEWEKIHHRSQWVKRKRGRWLNVNKFNVICSGGFRHGGRHLLGGGTSAYRGAAQALLTIILELAYWRPCNGAVHISRVRRGKGPHRRTAHSARQLRPGCNSLWNRHWLYG